MEEQFSALRTKRNDVDVGIVWHQPQNQLRHLLAKTAQFLKTVAIYHSGYALKRKQKIEHRTEQD